MADGRLRLEASANFSRLNSAFEKSKEKVARLEERLNRLEQGHTRLGKKGQSAFTTMARYAQSVVTGYVGIHAAIAAVNAGLQEEIELRRRAREGTRSYQEERLLFLQQAASFTDAQRSEFETRISNAGVRGGITEAEAMSIGRRALTATSGSDVDARIESAAGVVEAMVEMMGPTIRDTQGLPGAILDLQRTIGGSIENAVGFVNVAMTQSRLEDPEEAKNLIRTIAGAAAIQTGVEDKEVLAEQTLALFSAFQAVTGDVIGANTSTAIVNFIAALQRENGGRNLTPDQLVNALQDEEGIKFIGKSFSKPVQEDLIRSGSEITKIYRDNLVAVSQDFEEVYRKTVELTSGENDPELLAFRKERESKAEADRTSRQKFGISTSATDIVKTNAPLVNPWDYQRMIEVWWNNKRGDVESSFQLAEKYFLQSGILGDTVEEKNRNFRRFSDAKKNNRLGEFLEGVTPEAGNEQEKHALLMLEQIVAIMETQRAKESAERQADNAKLADTVGKAINQSVGNARLTSEQEN